MASPVGDVTATLRRQIEAFEAPLKAVDVGAVVEVGDGIARAKGLATVMASELVEFTKTGVLGMALNLEEDQIGIIILGDYTTIEEGDEVRQTGRIASVPVGGSLVGRGRLWRLGNGDGELGWLRQGLRNSGVRRLRSLDRWTRRGPEHLAFIGAI